MEARRPRSILMKQEPNAGVDEFVPSGVRGQSYRPLVPGRKSGREAGSGVSAKRAAGISKDRTAYCIRSVEHALTVLEQFLLHDELGITDLSHLLKLHKNKVFRILATLESRKYIEQSRVAGNYRLGVKTLLLGQTFLQHTGIVMNARSVLEMVVRQCQETCYLSVVRNMEVVYLESVESPLPVRVVNRVGRRFPLHCTAEGKALAAHVNPDMLRAYFEPLALRRVSPVTMLDRGESISLLKNVAKLGYALECGEAEPDVAGVAVPIRDHTRNVVGALGVSGPVDRITPQRVKDELLPLVLKAAEEVSVRLGYPR